MMHIRIIFRRIRECIRTEASGKKKIPQYLLQFKSQALRGQVLVIILLKKEVTN